MIDEIKEYRKNYGIPEHVKLVLPDDIGYNNYDPEKGILIPDLVHVVRHFIATFYDGPTPIRILEVGGNPMAVHHFNQKIQRLKSQIERGYTKRDLMGCSPQERLELEEQRLRDFIYPPSALLSEDDTICCVVDLEEFEPNTRWLDATYVQGDFLDPTVQERIVSMLDGKPHLILGGLVFVNDIGHPDRKIYKEGHQVTLNDFEPESLGLANSLTKNAIKLLDRGGYLFVENRSRVHPIFLPQILSSTDMTHNYTAQYVRVYRY